MDNDETTPGLTDDELERESGEPLPEREAMSLVTPSLGDPAEFVPPGGPPGPD